MGTNEPEPDAGSLRNTDSPESFSLPDLQDDVSVPIDGVGPGVGQAPIELNPHTVPGSSHPWSDIDWPIPTVSILYVVHRLYRRYNPRRLPPLTPFKLPSIYVALGIFTWSQNYGAKVDADICVPGPNRDLLSLEISRRKFKSWSQTNGYHERLPQTILDKLRDKVTMGLSDALWCCTYPQSGVLARIAWHSDHIWSPRPYWDFVSVLMLVTGLRTRNGITRNGLMMGVNPSDWNVMTTMLASTSSDKEKGCTLITRWVAGLSVPLAMLARASRRPQFALFLNGLQRLVFTAWVYLEGTRSYRYWSILKRFEEPDKVAKALEKFSGSNDDVINKVYAIAARARRM